MIDKKETLIPQLKIEKISGLPEEDSACGIFSKRIALADGRLGIMTVCILINDGENSDLQTILKDIFELSTKKMEGSSNGILDAVKLAAGAAKDYLADQNLDINFAFAFFYKDICYFAKFGQKVKILVFDQAEKVEITYHDGSGPVKKGQIYLLATDEFLSIIDDNILRSGQEHDIEETIDGLATEISNKSNQGQIGAVFVLVKDNGDQQEIHKHPQVQPSGVTDELSVMEENGMQQLDNQDNEEFIQTKEIDEEKEPQPAENVSLPKSKNPLIFVSLFSKKIIAILKSLKKNDIRAILMQRRNIFIASGLIFIILVFSATFALWQKVQSQNTVRFNQHYSQAYDKFTEGTAIIELNKQRARTILSEAEKEITLALEINRKDEKANTLKNDILAKLKETENLANIDFTDYFTAQATIFSLSYINNNLAVVSDGKFYEIDNANKTAKEVSLPQETQSGFAFSDSIFVFGNGKVFQVDIAGGKSQEIAQKDGVLDINGFLGNVYLLWTDQIFKIVPIENGYAPPTEYLNEKNQFGNQARFAIDGYIWVAANNKIYKFLRGSQQDFEIKGLSGDTGEFGAIYTSSPLDNLYVIDKVNSALLVIDKEGVYKKAYQSPDFAKANNLIVSEDETKMYIAVGNKILESNLQ